MSNNQNKCCDISALGRRFISATNKRAKARWNSLSWMEVSGSFGDLGTFLPLVLNMAAFDVIDFSSAVFWAGVFNIVTGISWDSPMPVQPMKTIAAVAVSGGNLTNPGLTRNEVIGAGMSVASVIFILGITGLIDLVNWIIPRPIVRGIQVGVGLKLVQGGTTILKAVELFADNFDCLILAAIASLIILATICAPKDSKFGLIPAALLLTIVGFIMAGFGASGKVTFVPEFPPRFALYDLTGSDILNGFLKAGLAQIPLTALNSIVSTVDLNNKVLFSGMENKKISRRSVAVSVALMNFKGLCLGGMPSCHGAGGLAGQYRFGARSGTAPIVLGLLKVIVSCILGGSAQVLLRYFPKSLLAVLQIFAGLALAVAGFAYAFRDARPRQRDSITEDSAEEESSSGEYISYANRTVSTENIAFVVLITAGGTLGFGTAWGFLIGVVAALFNGCFYEIWQDIKKFWNESKYTKHMRCCSQNQASREDLNGGPHVEQGY